MGDSYSDETSELSGGLPSWSEILVASGRADFGSFGYFAEDDPRNTLGLGSYTYNYAQAGATTTSTLGSTSLFPFIQNNLSQPGSPNRPDLWPGIRGAGLNSEISYASQLLGGNDILAAVNSGELLLGLNTSVMNQILSRAQSIANIATADFTSPLGLVVTTYPDIGNIPLYAGFPELIRASISLNTQYFNLNMQGFAAAHGAPVVDLWALHENARTNGLTVHGISIDPFAAGSGSSEQLNTLFYADGLHPTPIFQALWANEVLRALNSGYGESIPLLTSKELVTFSLLDPQDSPVATAGAGYTIDVGDPLSLSAQGSYDPDVGDAPYLTYSWDLNGDGDFSDAAGFEPTIPWSTLMTLGISHAGSWDIRVRVDDSFGGVTTSNSVALIVQGNQLPTADAGGPYTVTEGASLVLSAVASDPDPGDSLNYAWDINGDGNFTDAIGVSPTLSWTQLVALGLNDGPIAVSNLRVRVDDGNGGTTTSAHSSLSIVNSAPTVNILGPSATARGQETLFTLVSNDPSPLDQTAGFAFAIDWNDDGVNDQFISGPSGTTVSHVFDVAAEVNVRVTATDTEGGESDVAVHRIDSRPFELVDGDLIWYGTSGNDAVMFSQVDATTITISETTLAGQSVTTSVDVSGVTGKLVALGADGFDMIDASSVEGISATIDGGNGDDHILGGSAADTLHGGSGADTIFGGPGNDSIEGGNGDDTLYGEMPNPIKGTIYGSDTILGGDGDDSIFGDGDGGEGAGDVLFGGEGHDTIIGDGSIGSSLGNDEIHGDAGDDLLFGEPDGAEGASDSIFGESGNDAIHTGRGNDVAFGGNGSDIIIGGDGAEGANDSLLGEEGDDILIGDADHTIGEQLIGGADSLDGGMGSDIVLAGHYIAPDGMALLAIWREWNSERSFLDRVANILGSGVGPRENGEYYLIVGINTFDDRKATTSGSVDLTDIALGGSEEDWIFANHDEDSLGDLDLAIDLSVELEGASFSE